MTPERLAVYRKTFGAMSTDELRAIVEGRKPHKLSEETLEALRMLLAERKGAAPKESAFVKSFPKEESKTYSLPSTDSPKIKGDFLTGAPAVALRSTPDVSTGPSGVGGWLLFFCVQLMFLGPLVSGWGMFTSWKQAHAVSSRFPSILTAVTWAIFADAAFVIYGFFVGRIIWSGSPKGREVARMFLMIGLLGSVAMKWISVSIMGGDLPPEIHFFIAVSMIHVGCLQLAAFLIWWSYFRYSDRVQNTYGPRETKAEHLTGSLATPAHVGPAKTSGLAIASLVLGFLGFLYVAIAPLFGLVLGLTAIGKIKHSGGKLSGRGIAFRGVGVSLLALVLAPFMVGLLLPAFAIAKPRAQLMLCQNNLRQIALGVRIYGDDHNGQFPPAERWCDVLLAEGNREKIFGCPAGNKEHRSHYAYNAKLSGRTQFQPNTVLLFETEGGWNMSGGPELLIDRSRHKDGVYLFAFADGHVEQVPEARIPVLRWEP